MTGTHQAINNKPKPKESMLQLIVPYSPFKKKEAFYEKTKNYISNPKDQGIKKILDKKKEVMANGL